MEGIRRCSEEGFGYGGIAMEEYLRKVTEQVRCKKARPYIEQELRDHLEDQISENILEGMEQEEAIKSAVKEMGDPVETGIMLDKVHRPQIAWKIILLVGIISVIGLFVHIMFLKQPEAGQSVYDVIVSSSRRYLYSLGWGIAVMAVLYWLDYTVIARFSRIIAALMNVSVIMALFGGLQVNGMACWLQIGGIVISIRACMFLYVPVYGGILYKYYGKGYKGVVSAILWMIIPVFLVFCMSSIVTAILLLASMLVMLTIALMKSWFKVSKGKVIVSLWSIFGILPVIGLAIGYFGNIMGVYHQDRIRAFLGNSGEENYLTAVLRDTLLNSKLIGKSGIDIAGKVENINSDYLLTYLTSTYGLLVGMTVCCVIAALVFGVFLIIKKQKNQLGMMIGVGCGMIFSANFVINILVNVGVFPPTTTFLPFLSAGRGYMVVSYAMIGIILSIYRFKSIYPRHVRIDLYKKNII